MEVAVSEGGPRLSIVVPAYNVEEHIRNTLKSLSEQSLPFHEVIVVNDGSTDGTRSTILETVADSPIKNLRVIHQKNSGVSVARNVGIRACTGDYVIFLDGDDIVDVNLARTLHEDSKFWNEEPDVVYWKFHDEKFEQLEQGRMSDRWHQGIPEWSTGPETLRRVLIDRTQSVSIIAASYRLEFLRSSGLAFTPGCRTGEDSEFHCLTLGHALNVRFIDETLSTYIWRGSSATNSRSVGVFDAVLAYDRGARYLRAHMTHEDRDVVDAAERRVVPRFMDVFVDHSRLHEEGGIALLDALKAAQPDLVPIVRGRIREAETHGPVDKKWSLFRRAPRVAAWYFGSRWSQTSRPGATGWALGVLRAIRSRM